MGKKSKGKRRKKRDCERASVGRGMCMGKKGREVLHAKADEDKFRKSLETDSSKLVVRKKRLSSSSVFY